MGSDFGELHRRIAEKCENSEPSDEDVKEVYARFGLAYYQADVLHRGLCNLYCLSQLPPSGPVARPRVEEHLRTAFGSTLGQLLKRLTAILPPSLIPRLQVGLERRNFIAHHFWFERIHLMPSMTGIEAMIDELSRDTDLFCELDKEVEKLTAPLHSRLEITPELFTKALNEAMSKESDPLNQQRQPNKEETMSRVFDVPTVSGHSVLIFQSDDGVLWQLCDAGLGWTAYDRPDPAWLAAKKFERLLPVRVNPRPKTLAPWNFDMPFGSKATLSVRPGKRSGEVLYTLHAQTRATEHP
jgi:hypothetical protein